jgi:hypothetical protein
MGSARVNNFTIIVEKQFPKDIVKASFPLRYGKHSVIKTPDYEFLFNLNGEIKFIRGLNLKCWPIQAEQMKRTDGNDWVFYSVGVTAATRGVINWNGRNTTCPVCRTRAIQFGKSVIFQTLTQ